MNEVEIRQLFDRAAAEIHVGPPPDLKRGFQGWRPTWLTGRYLAPAAASMAVTSLLVGVALVPDRPGGGSATDSAAVGLQTSTTSPASEDTGLDCATRLREEGIFENWGTSRGEETPEAVATKLLGDGERVVLVYMKDKRARLIILRSDSTVRAEVGVAFDSDRGWFLETSYTCANEPLDADGSM